MIAIRDSWKKTPTTFRGFSDKIWGATTSNTFESGKVYWKVLLKWLWPQALACRVHNVGRGDRDLLKSCCVLCGSKTLRFVEPATSNGWRTSLHFRFNMWRTKWRWEWEIQTPNKKSTFTSRICSLSLNQEKCKRLAVSVVSSIIILPGFNSLRERVGLKSCRSHPLRLKSSTSCRGVDAWPCQRSDHNHSVPISTVPISTAGPGS